MNQEENHEYWLDRMDDEEHEVAPPSPEPTLVTSHQAWCAGIGGGLCTCEPRTEPPYIALICVSCKTRHDVDPRICGKCGGMTFEKVFKAGSHPSAPQTETVTPFLEVQWDAPADVNDPETWKGIEQSYEPAPSADTRIEFQGGGPCSACGDGDTAQKYHSHAEPLSRSIQRRVALQKGEPMPTFEPSTPAPSAEPGWTAKYSRDGGETWITREEYIASDPIREEWAESGPVDLTGEAQRWLEENAAKFWKQTNKSGMGGTKFDTVAALASFAAHLEKKA